MLLQAIKMRYGQRSGRCIPELVSTPEDGYKSVDFMNITAVSIEAVKNSTGKPISLRGEVMGRVEALEAKVKKE